ncbi:MAG: hypothetical protein QGH76_04565 [Phycisphaerales bacterium]|jgi:putative colanic acid biosynthesis acetyltransferase WcaF|nr:hypothetical protein [Phycisphaerales bacterium]
MLWPLVGRVVFFLTPQPAYPVRRGLLRLFGMSCGRRMRIRRSAWVTQPWNAAAGTLTVIGDGAFLDSREIIDIGARCVISQHAMLLTSIEGPGSARADAIHVEDDCWVAADTVVMPGAFLEQGVVVGARGLVDGRLPAWKICTGEPAAPRSPRTLHGVA